MPEPNITVDCSIDAFKLVQKNEQSPNTIRFSCTAQKDNRIIVWCAISLVCLQYRFEIRQVHT